MSNNYLTTGAYILTISCIIWLGILWWLSPGFERMAAGVSFLPLGLVVLGGGSLLSLRRPDWRPDYFLYLLAWGLFIMGIVLPFQIDAFLGDIGAEVPYEVLASLLSALIVAGVLWGSAKVWQSPARWIHKQTLFRPGGWILGTLVVMGIILFLRISNTGWAEQLAPLVKLGILGLLVSISYVLARSIIQEKIGKDGISLYNIRNIHQHPLGLKSGMLLVGLNLIPAISFYLLRDWGIFCMSAVMLLGMLWALPLNRWWGIFSGLGVLAFMTGRVEIEQIFPLEVLGSTWHMGEILEGKDEFVVGISAVSGVLMLAPLIVLGRLGLERLYVMEEMEVHKIPWKLLSIGAILMLMTDGILALCSEMIGFPSACSTFPFVQHMPVACLVSACMVGIWVHVPDALEDLDEKQLTEIRI